MLTESSWPIKKQYKRIDLSPHNVYWGCAPPVCVLDGNTKTNSSSALLKKKAHTSFTWATTDSACYIWTLHSMFPTCFWLFPQSWDLGHIRERLLPRSRFQENGVSHLNQLPIPLDPLKAFPQHQSLLSLWTQVAADADWLISQERLRCKSCRMWFVSNDFCVSAEMWPV